jgi:hypothetical protein
MELNKLKALFLSAGVLLVEVEHIEDPDESDALCVIGTVDEFLSAIKALNIPVAFVYAEKLEEEDFLYSTPVDELVSGAALDPDADPETDIDVEEYDLCAENPELFTFKQYIGAVGLFTLFAALPPKGLAYVLENDWWARFHQSQYAAIARIEARNEAED